MTPGMVVVSTIAAAALLVSVAVLVTGSHGPWLVFSATVGLLLTARAELAHRLRRTGPKEAGANEPAWWPEFEREFHAYVARGRERQRRHGRTP